MRLTRRLLLALCMAWLAAAAVSPAGAQDANPAPWSRLTGPLFSHITQAQGLPYPVALALIQGRDGFIWIGTPGGLARWDGSRMRVFVHRSGDPDSLPENIVSELLVDEQGRLWVGTVSGMVARYVPERESFVTHREPEGASGRMLGMKGDGQGGIWTVGTAGAAHLDTVSGRWRHEELPPGGGLSVQPDSKGTVWLGTPQGLLRRDAGRDAFQAVALPPSLKRAGASALYEDAAGRIWFGTVQGQLGFVDAATNDAHAVDAVAATGNRITGIVEPVPGTVWTAEFGGGIRALDTHTGAVRAIRHDAQAPTSLSDNTVTGLIKDRSGLVWASTLGGVDVHNPANPGILTVLPTTPGGLLGKDVRSMSARADGTVWLGFRSGGVSLLDPVAGRVAEVHPGQGLPVQMAQAVAALSDGGVLVGTRQGLHRVDPATGTSTDLEPLAGASVLSILAEEPSVWVGGTQGLTRLDLAGGSARTFVHDRNRPDSLSDNSVQALLRDRAGRLWVGTQRGLNLFEAQTGTFRRFLNDPASADSLPNDVANTLLEDRRGRIWVGTANGIGILADPGGDPRFHRLDSRSGLPHDMVTVLLEDPDGVVWAGGGDRLARIDPDSFAVRVFGPVEGAGIRTHWAGSGARLPDGTLLFGGFGGMTVIRPGVPPAWRFQPPVVATTIRIGGRPVTLPPNAPITLAPSDRSVEVDFAALDFSEPQRNRYAYRLEGFDDHWIETDADHATAAYTALPPGSYRLLVRGSNRESVWSETPLSLPLVVLPAWYQTNWFRAGAGLAGLGLTLAGMQGWTAILRRRQRVLERQVVERTAELETARALALAEADAARRSKEEAEDADRAKSRFLAVVSHEIRTPLNAVLGMLQMLDAGGLDGEQRRRVSIAKDAGQTLIALIESILEFGRYEAESPSVHLSRVDPRRLGEGTVDLFRPQATAKGVELVLEMAPGLPPLVLCDQVRIARVLHNLLGNAIKFTQQGRIVLSLWFEPDGTDRRGVLHADVSDTGIGIAPSMRSVIFEDFTQADDSIARRFGGTGLGLSVCRRIAVLLGGSLTVDSALGAGSTFRFSVPVEIAGDASAAPSPTADTKELKILLIDDDPVNREVGTWLLRHLGHHVTSASGSDDAVERIVEGPFDVIMADLHMPGEDGIDTCRRLRAVPGRAAQDGRFIIMTADVTDVARERCAQARIDAVLSKPLHLDALREALADLCAPTEPAGALDRRFLAMQMEALGGTELARLILLFARTSRRIIRDLETAMEARDPGAVQAQAHKLRSAAGALGLSRLSSETAAIETATAGSPALNGEWVAILKRLRRGAIDALLQALRSERSGAPEGGQAGSSTGGPSR
ncbi:two-component regulator propeller domain-containing protein [Azospirillum sp. sgz301742]